MTDTYPWDRGPGPRPGPGRREAPPRPPERLQPAGSKAQITGLSGAQLAEFGQIKAIKNADPVWLGQALGAIKWCAENDRIVTADDVWARLEAVGAMTAGSPSALGTLIKRDAYKRLGWLAPGEGYIASKRPERHLSPVRVWRSLVFKPRRLTLPGLGPDDAAAAGLE